MAKRLFVFCGGDGHKERGYFSLGEVSSLDEAREVFQQWIKSDCWEAIFYGEVRDEDGQFVFDLNLDYFGERDWSETAW